MKKFLGPVTFWKCVAALIFLFGFYATYIRFTGGLGAATNLTDLFPWGFWVGFDVLVGVGLAAGGFVIAATVHIFNLKKYHDISRPAILTAFLGYMLVCVALLFDLGRPLRIWHPLIMWNPHSVMFEVAWCVTLYTTVLALEFSPIVFERFKWHVPLKLVRAIYLPIVIVGVLLSTLHQSSLGTLYVIVPDKLHALWYSPFLPIFFFVSAIAAGLAMTILESFLSHRAFGKHLETETMVGLSRVLVVVLAIYAVFKLQDLGRRGSFPLLWEATPQTILFWGEISLGLILPMILLLIPKVRENESGLFFSTLLVVVGFVVNRLNVSITGMIHSETYFPKWTEIAITLMIVTAGFVLFAFAIKYFPVFPKKDFILGSKNKSPVFTGNVVILLWTLFFLGAVVYHYTQKHQANERKALSSADVTLKTVPPDQSTLKIPAPLELPRGDGSPGLVVFKHTTHLSSNDLNCYQCHANFSILKLDRSPLKKASHETCGSCHNGSRVFSFSDDCSRCHQL